MVAVSLFLWCLCTYGVSPTLVNPGSRLTRISSRARSTTLTRIVRPCNAISDNASKKSHSSNGGLVKLSSFGLGLLLAAGSMTGLPQDAHAILSNPNAGMPRSASAALRRAVPVVNEKLGSIQADLEKAQYLLRFPNRKPWGQMSTIADQCLVRLEADKAGVLAGIEDQRKPEAEAAIRGISEALDGMQLALANQDSDRTATYLNRALLGTSDLEMLEMPNLPYALPSIYRDFPYLKGRAQVQMNFEGVSQPLKVTIDGYSAPLTCGNFMQNVKKNIYRGSEVKIADKTTVFVRPQRNGGVPSTPLEIRLKDEFRPDYRQALDVANGDYPALPLSIYGAVAMSHGSEDTLNAPAEFFIYKFDRASMGGLGGLSFEEGQFSVFGYVTEDSREALEALSDGAKLSSVEVTRGLENLVNDVSASTPLAS